MTKKIEMLRFLEKEPDQDARQVAEALKVSSEAAGMLVLRLFRQGLLQRELDPDNRMYFYSLTPKGWDRLHYFRNCTGSLKGHHAQNS